MNQHDGEIITLDEVSAYLKADKQTVFQLVRQG